MLHTVCKQFSCHAFLLGGRETGALGAPWMPLPPQMRALAQGADCRRISPRPICPGFALVSYRPMTAPPSSPRYIALAGPTASGKTAAALALAQHAQAQWGLTCEIVSVDSALVYRGMDIGTAKPSASERAWVAHHLIDIIDPTQSYSAAQFVHDAQRLLAHIHARGHLPLLVGGTMLYFKALFEGLSDIPAADPAVRSALAKRAAQRGWPALHTELAQVDAATAARLEPTDSQRIGRALEVWQMTGQPLSQFHAQGQGTHLRGMRPALFLSLEPAERAWLHARIAQRFEAMLAQGFVQEMHALRQRGDLHADLPSMRCVGYRQAWQALETGEPLAAWCDKAIAATRQLAKRQLTWLRGMPQRHPIPCDGPNATSQVLAAADPFLEACAKG